MTKENVEQITCKTLAGFIEKATPVQIVDIRNDEHYGKNDKIIPGAILATFDTLDEVMGKLNKNIEVVIYCTSPGEASSSDAAEKMLHDGFTKVRVLEGGFNAWEEQGYPAEIIQEVSAGR
jgi:rhodanese-related sulfurtransferase